MVLFRTEKVQVSIFRFLKQFNFHSISKSYRKEEIAKASSRKYKCNVNGNKCCKHLGKFERNVKNLKPLPCLVYNEYLTIKTNVC